MFFKMKKTFLAIFIYYVLYGFANGATLNKIIIENNIRVNTETIILFSKVKIGDELDQNDLNNILKDLYDTDFFSDIELNFENSILTLNVTENPIIQNLVFKGIKSKDFLKALKDRVSIKEKNPFIENKVKSELEKIKNILQESGFYFSNVSLSKKENDNNTIDLIFDINLGEKSYINKIIFLGDKKFKKRQLLNVIASEEDKFWKFISKKRLLDNQRISLDKRLLESFYKNRGYYNVKIVSDTVQYQDNQKFNLVFNIDSGIKYYFGEFDINFPDDYEEKYFEKAIRNLNEYSGEKYSFKVIEKMLKEIEKIASNNQFDFVDAKIDEEITENKININIDIEEDSIKTYVKKINILGNNITIEDVVRNELIIDEGDPLNNVLFNKSVSNIKSLNIFKSVKTEIKDTDDNLRKEIDIIVEEKPTGEVSVGAGVGTSGTSTSFGVRENNFLGQGIKLNSNISLSEETLKGMFSYTKPNFKNSDRDLTLSVQSNETDRLKDYGYKTNDTGFSIGTRFEHLEDFFISPTFSTNYESIETSSTASSRLKKQSGDYFDVEGKYILDYDKRDQRFQPTDGFLSSFSQQLPFNIEDNQTIINSYEFTAYHEYLEDLVASISLFGMNANSFGEDDVRISDRLFMPSRKLRGFEAGKVGPIDNGDYVGGNYLTSLNVSSNLPVFPSLETIDFNVFYDAANIWGVDYNSQINDSSALRSSTGLAIDWFTPIGPLSFSFSQALTKKSTDKTESFRFNLGTTF